jgi:hypothetical protein
MKNRILITFVLLIMLQSCKGQNKGIDSAMNKFSETDFSNFKTLSIYFRSKGNQTGSSIYFVNIYKGNCSPYVVEVDDNSHSIIEIKNHLVISSCGKDYLTKEKIEVAVKKYIELDIYLLQVDNDGNVYINPDKQGVATLLRKSPNSTPTDLQLFRHYQGNWYVKK